MAAEGAAMPDSSTPEPLPRSRRLRGFLPPPPPAPLLRSPEVRRILGLGLPLPLLLVFWIVFEAGPPRPLGRVFAAGQAPASAPAASRPSLEELREERRRLLPTLFEGSLLGVVDRTDFVETERYRRLLELLWAYPEEEAWSRGTALLDY